MAINRFSRPIPGQSLTTAPRSAKWEKPPKYVNRDDALEFVMKQLMDAKHLGRLVTLLESGATVEDITRVILFTGFSEGLWNYDLMVLMAQPVGAMVAVAYHSITGKRPAKMTRKEGQADPELARMMRMKNARGVQDQQIAPEQEAKFQAEVKSSGILGGFKKAP